MILFLTDARTAPISGRTYTVMARFPITNVESLENYIARHALYMWVAPNVSLRQIEPSGEWSETVVVNHASSGELPVHAFDHYEFGWRPDDALIDPDSQEDLHPDAAAALTTIGALAAFKRQAGELRVIVRWVPDPD